MKNRQKTISRSLSEFLILAIVFFTPLVFAFYPWSYNIFEINKVILFRILTTLALLAFVWFVFSR
ncbi:hypothetical protein GF382_00880, partial [Candidatus Falkowbacteria bacterium]|nr:hypothetical protein [Candidatus Falkowbacteria bacterium]